MTKRKEYLKYKDSGIKWIGKIPEEWEIGSAKYFLDIKGGYAFKSNTFAVNGIPIIRIGDIKNGSVDLKNCKRVPYHYYNELKEYSVHEGDIVIALTGATIGKIGEIKKSDKKILLNQRVGVLSSKFPNYYKYVLNSDFIQSQIKLISEGSAQENISNEDIKNFKILKINSKTKKDISKYLDSKTTIIEQTISKNKKLIELLKEKRTSLINQTVTKGLNPDVPMKESGIEWIGEIPEHWNKVQLRAYFIEHKKKNKSLKETNLLSLSYGKIIRKNIHTKDGLLPENFENYNVIKKGYIVLRLTDLQNDKKSLRTGLCSEKGIITSAYVTIKSYKEINTDYVHYLLHSYDINKIFYNMGAGVRQNMNFEEFSRLPLLIPNINEQKEIAKYLDNKTQKIDKTIEKVQKNIELLEEYKESLIHHVVTGKIDVRGVEV